MGLFDFFKKDEEKEIKVDFTLNDLKKGYMVDYFMKSWEVKNVYEYDWGNNFYSKEYFIDSGNEKLYLQVEDDDELVCSIWTKVDIFDIDADLAKSITATDDAPDKIVYDNQTFIRKESSQAHCKEDGQEGTSELVNWTYVNRETKDMLSIDRWGEEEYGAAVGKYVKEREFSNILPR